MALTAYKLNHQTRSATAKRQRSLFSHLGYLFDEVLPSVCTRLSSQPTFPLLSPTTGISREAGESGTNSSIMKWSEARNSDMSGFYDSRYALFIWPFVPSNEPDEKTGPPASPPIVMLSVATCSPLHLRTGTSSEF